MQKDFSMALILDDYTLLLHVTCNIRNVTRCKNDNTFLLILIEIIIIIIVFNVSIIFKCVRN